MGITRTDTHRILLGVIVLELIAVVVLLVVIIKLERKKKVKGNQKLQLPILPSARSGITLPPSPSEQSRRHQDTFQSEISSSDLPQEPSPPQTPTSTPAAPEATTTTTTHKTSGTTSSVILSHTSSLASDRGLNIVEQTSHDDVIDGSLRDTSVANSSEKEMGTIKGSFWKHFLFKTKSLSSFQKRNRRPKSKQNVSGRAKQKRNTLPKDFVL